MSIYTVPITEEKIKLRYREKYLTEGANERASAIIRGLYRGFYLAPTGVPDKSVWLVVDPFSPAKELDPDSFAIYNAKDDAGDAYALSIRETGSIELDLTTIWPGGLDTLYVYMEASYSLGSATAATYNVSDEDPHDSLSSNYNPYALMIGIITYDFSIGNLDFDPEDPGLPLGWYRYRTTPQPTWVDSDLFDGGYEKGDQQWGAISGFERRNLPDADEKDAMDFAASPSQANPFATMGDGPLKYIGEPTKETHTLNPGFNTIDLSGWYYIGKSGIARSANQYFALMQEGKGETAYNPDDNLPMRIVYIYKESTTTPVDPTVDSDTNGFILNPRVAYISSASAADYDLWAFRKEQISTLEQVPAHAMPVGGVVTLPHSSYIRKILHTTPPVGDAKNYGFVDNSLRRLDVSNRGYAPEDWTNGEVSSRAYLMGTADAQMFAPQSDNVRSILPWTTTQMESWRDPNSGVPYLIMPLYDPVGSGIWAIGKYDTVGGSITTKDMDPEMPSGTWHLTSIAVDEDSIYVRLYRPSDTAERIHALNASDLQPKWPSSVLVAASSLSLFSVYDPHIAVVDDTRVAVNLWANDLLGGIPGTHVIVFYDKSNGAFIAGGSGDATTQPLWPFGAGSSFYARGPFCSDGENIYWPSYRDLTDTGPILQLNIANPSTSAVANWSHNGLGSSARTGGVVYDGDMIWGFGEDEVGVCLARGSGIGYYSGLQLANPGDEFWGGVCIDGKNIWAVTLNLAIGRFELHKISPRKLSNMWGLSVPLYDDVIESRVSILDNEAVNFLSLRWYNRPCFDGENIWVIPDVIPGFPWTGYIYRLPLVKYL